MRSKFVYSAAGLFLCVAGTASATVIDFNYTNLGVVASSTQNSVDMNVDGIGVTVTAYTIGNDGAGNISDMSQLTGSDAGVYVSGSTSGNLGVRSYNREGTLLDGGSTANDQDEGLLFSFTDIVSFDFIDFDYFTAKGGDNFNLTVDGVTILWGVDSINSSSLSPLVSSVSGKADEFNFADISGQNFLFWADENSDSFYIDKIRVSVVNAVPEPGSLLLLSIGFLGLLFRGGKQLPKFQFKS